MQLTIKSASLIVLFCAALSANAVPLPVTEGDLAIRAGPPHPPPSHGPPHNPHPRDLEERQRQGLNNGNPANGPVNGNPASNNGGRNGPGAAPGVSIYHTHLQATGLTLTRLLPLPIEMAEIWKSASAKDQTGMGQPMGQPMDLPMDLPMDQRTETQLPTTEDVMGLELLLE